MRQFKLSADTIVLDAAARAIRKEFDRDPAYVYEQATVPSIPELAAVSAGEQILVGFGLATDGMHYPNESFSL